MGGAQKYKMVVLTRPQPDSGDAFNVWYDTCHVPELLMIPGMLNCQRYKLAVGDGWDYMAIYDVETDNLDALMTEMYRRVDDGEIFMSPTFGTFSLVAGSEIGPFQVSLGRD